MPIFKVCLAERKKRVLVKASTLDELKVAALLKHGVKEGTVSQIVLEEDGTEVDDTDVLLELASTSMLQYMMLIGEEVWSPLSLPGGPLNGTNDTSTEQVLTPNAPCTQRNLATAEPPVRSPVSSSRCTIPDIPWDRFPQDLVMDCRQQKVPSPGDRREVVKIVGKYLGLELNETSRSTVEMIARSIVNRYPTMGDRVGTEMLGKGYESLFSQLYNKVMFEKKIRKDRLQASSNCAIPTTSASLEDVDDPQTPTTLKGKKRPRDSYGCVAWQPDSFPEGETNATQEEKRLFMDATYTTYTANQQETVKKLMETTYVSQRIQINNKEAIGSIIASWPFLTDIAFLTVHFSTLVGMDTKKEWLTALEIKAKDIVNYMASSKGNKKEAILKIIIPMRTACQNASSELPISEAVVPLLVTYFGDTGLFQMFEVTDTELQVEEGVTVNHPVLAILGSSFHAENTKCLLVVEGKTFMRPSTLVDGFFALFACYYVFNMAYPESCSSSLEFIQRILFSINPTTGDKRGGKRKKMTCDAKVVKLAAELSVFTNTFQIDSA